MKSSCTVIIGSTGFIGSSLLSILPKTTDLYTISKSKSLNDIPTKHLKLNISDKCELKVFFSQLWKEYRKIKIFFLAGESSVESSIRSPENSIIDTIKSFTNLLEVLKEGDSTLVLASSGSIYDSREKDYFLEEDKLYPPSPYAAIKYAIEGIAISYSETFNMDIRIARIFSVFGENMERFFIHDVVTKLLSEENEIILKGSGMQGRDYLYVNDVSRGLINIMENGFPKEIYNLSSGRLVLLSDLAERIKGILNLDHINIVWDNMETHGERDLWYGDNTKIKMIGFNESNDFNYLLESTVLEIKSRVIKK